MRLTLQNLRAGGSKLLCSGMCGALALVIGVSANTNQTVFTRLDPAEFAINSLERTHPQTHAVTSASAKRASGLAVFSGAEFENLLGSKSIRVESTTLHPRWSAVLAEAASQKLLSACENKDEICSARRLVAMRAEVSRLRGLSRSEQIAGVNSFVNSTFRYATDAQTYGVGDHWATLKEFLVRGQGDCEDFAIAKFWMLIALEVPSNAVRLVVLHDAVSRADHAVLAVQYEGRVEILDNRSKTVLNEKEITAYHPIYSMSGAGNIWVHLAKAVSVARFE